MGSVCVSSYRCFFCVDPVAILSAVLLSTHSHDPC